MEFLKLMLTYTRNGELLNLLMLRLHPKAIKLELWGKSFRHEYYVCKTLREFQHVGKAGNSALII